MTVSGAEPQEAERLGPLDEELDRGDQARDAELRFIRRRAWASGYLTAVELPVPSRLDSGEREAWLRGFDEGWQDARGDDSGA